MQFVIQSLLFAAGFVLIVFGGDTFVDAALLIGRRAGISTLVLGATLVSLTTTLPELFVSTIASTTGHVDMAIGNAVGSIICNTGLILGLCALIAPMVLAGPSQVKKALLLLLSIFVLFLLALRGPIGPGKGLILYGFLAVYILLNFQEAKSDPQKEPASEPFSIKQIFLFLLGAGCIILGSDLLVQAASNLAGLLGVPEKLIALSVVALGTSLPELVTSLTAIKKKESGLSIGNIIGANILNIVLVMATSAMAAPGGLTTQVLSHGPLAGWNQLLLVDIPVAFSLGLILFLSALRKRVSRPMGLLLLCVYGGYITFMTWAVL